MDATDQRLLGLVRRQLDNGTITLDSPISALGDSLDWLELQWAIEAAFAVRLPEGKDPGFHTVAELAEYLRAATVT